MSLITVEPERILATVARYGLAEGRKRLHLGAVTWFALLERYPKLQEQAAEAESWHLENLVPLLLKLPRRATTDFQLKQAKLITDRIAWLLERRLPERYGNRVQHSLAVTFDLRVAVDEARARVDAITVEVIPDAVSRLVG